MSKPTSAAAPRGQIVSVPRWDRWSIYHRLQQLDIPCACPKDGTLRVDVQHAVDLVLVRSTVQQFTATRQVSLDWLERCWESRVAYTADH